MDGLYIRMGITEEQINKKKAEPRKSARMQQEQRTGR